MKKFVTEIYHTLDWRGLEPLSEWVLHEAMTIQQIPAPTFHEAQRAAYIAQRFAALGLQGVEIDALHNVYGRLAGSEASIPGLLLIAHLDTVFDAHTDLSLRREAPLVYGPGLGDNSTGVAGLLGGIKALCDAAITPECDIWFVATTAEEGLGDLKGIRAAFARLHHDIGAVINLEGLAFGHVFHAGIAVHRLKITARAEGGHSWVHFGRPSAIDGLVQLGAKITRLPLPGQPRTTFNLGMIEGGHAINAIATDAHLWLDMRSEVQSELDDLRRAVQRLINNSTQPGLTFTTQVVGDRPAGRLDPEHPLVEGALAALEVIGVRGALEAGSTDANIPLAAGCPAVTIGITRGGNAHRLDEYIDTQPIGMGMRQLVLVLLAAARQQYATHYRAAGD